ncbi:hypothetical protein BUE80_DR007888 [Diplocarpon rosae]|nr:hypothetical protein BUE80_DR007888 [Diplocarpon rosae]
MISVMVVGILFAAHGYYRAMGGQGFLKVRRGSGFVSMQQNNTHLYLPLRREEIIVKGSSILGLMGRSPKNVPFYTCGDQRNSCENYEQPDICCPVTMACYRAKFTPSGIFCCNNSRSEFDCEPSKDDPPKCIEGTVQCSEATGGGCCPSTKECSPNGCIHVVSASIIGASSTDSIYAETSSTNSAPFSSVTRNSVSIVGTPITVTSTVTERPEATQTLAKLGEVMQARGSKGSITMALSGPYPTVCLLIGVAAFMGLL